MEIDKKILAEATKYIRENEGLKVSQYSYGSPRFSAEFSDCSMPMTFDSLSRCSLGCQYCASVDTPIYGPYFRNGAERGKRKLKDIQVGDIVWAYNAETDNIEEDIVTSTMARTVNEYFEIELETGHTLKITGEHPVYIKGKGWIPVDQMEEGDELLRVQPYINRKTGGSNLAKRNISDKARKTLSDRMKANNPMKREEIAKKVSDKQKQNWADGTNVMTDEHKEKVRKAAKNRMLSDNNPAYTRGRGGEPSIGEKVFKEVLDELGINYVQEFRFKGPDCITYNADFYLPDIPLIIEYDRHPIHFTEGGIERDKRKDDYILTTYGIRTIRFKDKSGRHPFKVDIKTFLTDNGIVR